MSTPFLPSSEKKGNTFWSSKSAENRWAESLWVAAHRYTSIPCASKLLWVYSYLKLGHQFGRFSKKRDFQSNLFPGEIDLWSLKKRDLQSNWLASSKKVVNFTISKFSKLFKHFFFHNTVAQLEISIGKNFQKKRKYGKRDRAKKSFKIGNIQILTHYFNLIDNSSTTTR